MALTVQGSDLVTLYASDRERLTVVASWGTGYGREAADVVADARGSADAGGELLALALEVLSKALWRSYTHPATAAPSLDVNTEGWRRERARQAFTEVTGAIRHPNLPSEDGLCLRVASPLEQAHQVGRVVHFGGFDLDQIVTEADRELDAIARAELGDFAGRAAQALELSRIEASPTQVARAHELIREQPLHPPTTLRTEVDPTAATVAVAMWLLAAAQLAGESSDTYPTDVILAADGINKLDVDTPNAVLEQLIDELDPAAVITNLVARAQEVADGAVPDLEDFIEIVRANAEATTVHEETTLAVGEEPEPRRLCLADPKRPAPSLRDSLLEAIAACASQWEDDDYDFDTEDDAAATDDSEARFTELLRERMTEDYGV